MNDARFRQWLARVERNARLDALPPDDPRRAEWTAPYRGPHAQEVDALVDSLHQEWGRK